jgi:putative ATPase
MFDSETPLAERLRPNSLEEYIGQEHLTGKNGVFRTFIEHQQMPSFILWGPPGVGKTSLALLLSKAIDKPFYSLSAVHSGVKDVREVLAKAEKGGDLFAAKKPIVFIDEIHRFSKSQQDSLLGAVEKGSITLIGATTENPSFEVISPLLSRCQVYVLKEHSKIDLEQLLKRAITHDKIIKKKKVTLKETDALLAYSGGDCRKLLNALEMLVNSSSSNNIVVDNKLAEHFLQENKIRYDKAGDQHYDIVSAFIKSIRGSDPNAAVYWLARMLEGGEDPKFIARRLLISASEDIGNANPTALIMATNTFQAVQMVGMPEARIILSQCAVYLASSAKSNASYIAIKKAISEVRETGNTNIPLHLRNAPTKLMKKLDYGKDYQYSHDFPKNFVEQQYLPHGVNNKEFIQFGSNKREQDLKNYLKQLWKDKYKF